jgi:hypothetical protein
MIDIVRLKMNSSKSILYEITGKKDDRVRSIKAISSATKGAFALSLHIDHQDRVTREEGVIQSFRKLSSSLSANKTADVLTITPGSNIYTHEHL